MDTEKYKKYWLFYKDIEEEITEDDFVNLRKKINGRSTTISVFIGGVEREIPKNDIRIMSGYIWDRHYNPKNEEHKELAKEFYEFFKPIYTEHKNCQEQRNFKGFRICEHLDTIMMNSGWQGIKVWTGCGWHLKRVVVEPEQMKKMSWLLNAYKSIDFYESIKGLTETERRQLFMDKQSELIKKMREVKNIIKEIPKVNNDEEFELSY